MPRPGGRGKREGQLSSGNLVKTHRREIADRFATPDNAKGFVQVANTLLPLAALWCLVPFSAGISYWLTAVITLLITLFLVRAFVLMHDCGHGSLFRSGALNRGFGFALGVVTGMPQYVWSQHHAFHHSTNGNWAKYRGPFIIDTAEEYGAMSARRQRMYRLLRRIPMMPLHAFVYVLVMPRYNWLRGKWSTPLERWHMTWNNVVLLSLWLAMSLAIGPGLFFAVYVASVTLATAVGIIVFTVQHNFPGSYASGDEGWDYDDAAIHGTSFLVLPAWVNWFTSNIAYHHVHHLSARIPNYRLAQCHAEYQHLFVDVPRIRLSEIPRALEYILWDTRARRIVSVAEFEASRAS